MTEKKTGQMSNYVENIIYKFSVFFRLCSNLFENCNVNFVGSEIL